MDMKGRKERNKKKKEEKKTGEGEKENGYRGKRNGGEKKREFFPAFRRSNLDDSRVKVDPRNESYV